MHPQIPTNMKTLRAIFAMAFLTVVMVSCTSDEITTSESYDLTTSTSIPIENQSSNLYFDYSRLGVYHGIVASGTSSSRGKIWINVGNDSQYNASLKLVGSPEITFQLPLQVNAVHVNTLIYNYVSTEGSFTLDLTDYNSPVISEILINNEAHFGAVVKSRSQNSASSMTATFTETGNPAFSGTWNIIADGSIENANGMNGDGITSMVITYDGNMYSDFEFDNFNATACFSIPSFVPILETEGIPNYVISSYQTSEFAGGIVKWDLGYNPSTVEYTNYHTCTLAVAGSFVWVDPLTNVTRVGTIIID